VNILIVAAHPDDEVLGCGGTAAYWSQRGHRLSCCFMSEHVTARHEKPEHDLFLKQISSAHKILGIKKSVFHDFPNIEMNTIPTLTLVKAIEQAIVDFKPDTILTHHWGDVNEDHVRTFDATVAALRLPQRGTHPKLPRDLIRRVLCYEVPSSTDWAAPVAEKAFHPNVFFNIDKTFKSKCDALKKYVEVVREFPHPCSLKGLESLAQFRGTQAGFPKAEAFYLLREINV